MHTDTVTSLRWRDLKGLKWTGPTRPALSTPYLKRLLPCPNPLLLVVSGLEASRTCQTRRDITFNPAIVAPSSVRAKRITRPLRYRHAPSNNMECRLSFNNVTRVTKATYARGLGTVKRCSG